MNNIAILEGYYEYDYVEYYTVRIEVDGVLDRLSETDKFIERYDDRNHSHFNEFDTILRVVDAMGNNLKGAEYCLFRLEDAANALPPPRKQAERVLDIEIIENSELRLYCIRLTHEVVILLNGGIKTTNQALDCPNVSRHFRFAQSVAKEINSLIVDRSIQIKDKKIINNTGEDDIILYF